MVYLIECYPKQCNIEKIVQLNGGQKGIILFGKLLKIAKDNLKDLKGLIEYLKSEKIIFSVYEKTIFIIFHIFQTF